jgi:hypothetical protein
VSVAFNEDIPLNQRISEDLYRWMSAETFNGCEPLFRYTLNDAEFQDFSTFIGGRWSLATLQAYDWPTPDLSGYRRCGFCEFHFSGYGVYQDLDD